MMLMMLHMLHEGMMVMVKTASWNTVTILMTMTMIMMTMTMMVAWISLSLDWRSCRAC